ncbi:MAG: hypothetical protein PVI06_06130, partial [Desulfobacterales bacterium]
MRSVLLAVAFLISFTSHGLSLVYVEKDGVFFYYPVDEGEIAERLIKKYPAMTHFLEQQGVKVTLPLHVILDDKLDTPAVRVHMIPHREIRIPLRAPGVLEEGYTEADPWAYFLFKGLSLQGIYSIRSGIPGGLHKVFGEIISPNIIIPEWTSDGICHLLYALFKREEIHDPFYAAITKAARPPDIDKISNHPGTWPGRDGYRIYGRPFMRWVYQNYGWSKLYDFIKRHGYGVLPIEIDLKARKSFEKSWSELWQTFSSELVSNPHKGQGLLITGYWSEPFVYWNASGVYPGAVQFGLRGRYGYVDANKTLWLSEYDDEGLAKVIKYVKGMRFPLKLDHAWDPGPGGVAVTRRGHRPYLILFSSHQGSSPAQFQPSSTQPQFIAAPEGVLQLSGPVQDQQGRIAVAANSQGNWDIWLYDRDWCRITDAPSLEMDPWWEGDRLVFASNVTGVFQIHDAEMKPLTNCKNGAVLPRKSKYLCLAGDGWQVLGYAPERTHQKSRACPAIITPDIL